VDGKAVEPDDAKSEDSERTLPIPDTLRAELKAAHKRQAKDELASGAAYNCRDPMVPTRHRKFSNVWLGCYVFAVSEETTW
jgi:hypothetical protein